MAAGTLALAREPRVTAMPLLPGHRLLRVHLRNDGDVAITLRRLAIRLLDAAGADLEPTVRPPRLDLAPGETGALDLAYRTRAGCGPPARLEHAGDAVDLEPGPTSGPRA
jgi:hypothetical protein